MVRDFTDVDDLAKAVALLLQQPHTRCQTMRPAAAWCPGALGVITPKAAESVDAASA
jgi:nucleoside-diphosphate-sugar epimerase